MNEIEHSNRLASAKSQSRGIGCDMSSDSVIRRLEIVDELRELAKELQAAKRIGTVDANNVSTISQPNCEPHSIARQ